MCFKADYQAAQRFTDRFVQPAAIHPVAFTMPMYHAAAQPFDRFGRGRGHPAKLNLGDCMAYAVAKHHDAPLLQGRGLRPDRHPPGASLTRSP